MGETMIHLTPADSDVCERLTGILGWIMLGEPRYNLTELADAIGICERGTVALRRLYDDRIRELNIAETKPAAPAEPPPPPAKRKRGRPTGTGARRSRANGTAPPAPAEPAQAAAPLFDGADTERAA
jgi:hypothetical protein